MKIAMLGIDVYVTDGAISIGDVEDEIRTDRLWKNFSAPYHGS